MFYLFLLKCNFLKGTVPSTFIKTVKKNLYSDNYFQLTVIFSCFSFA